MDPVRPAAASLITPPGRAPATVFQSTYGPKLEPCFDVANSIANIINRWCYVKRWFFFFQAPVLAMIDGAGERLGPGPVLQLFVVVPHFFSGGVGLLFHILETG